MLTLKGKENIPLDMGTAVITIHSMEQLANSFQPILNYFLSQKPGIVFHLEPILELYDPEDPFDILAIQYHKKKNYLNGYLPALEELEQKKLIKIIQKHRFYSVIAHNPHERSGTRIIRPKCLWEVQIVHKSNPFYDRPH